jgi:hypothetical protein
MTSHAQVHLIPAILIGYIVLLMPPVQHALTASMALQTLVQIPLLAAIGWLAAVSFPPRIAIAVDPWNRGGFSGLILAVSTAAFWMLPRSLDAATTDPLMIAAKFVSIPLLIGVAMGLSWPRMGFVLRGFVLLELVATLFRLGWLYTATPIRLCNAYLLGDQQRSGQYMLWVGVILLLGFGTKLIWGSTR